MIILQVLNQINGSARRKCSNVFVMSIVMKVAKKNSSVVDPNISDSFWYVTEISFVDALR
jgi:hypothetical protein